jgi:hypothetical protein
MLSVRGPLSIPAIVERVHEHAERRLNFGTVGKESEVLAVRVGAEKVDTPGLVETVDE